MVAQIEELMRSVRVGDRVDVEQLSLFPLSCSREQGIEDVAVLEEGVAQGGVTVTEIGEEGAVPEVFIKNRLERTLFILEGEEIVGAKQNRVFNISMLVPAAADLKAPVSCVEAGRWRRRSGAFASGARASTRVRRNLSRSVSYSIRREPRNMQSDQGQVWDDVHEDLVTHEAFSATSALADAYGKVSKTLTGMLKEIKLPDDCVGVAVAVGGKLVGLEMLGSISLWKRHEQRILRSFAFDAIGVSKPKRRPGRAAVAKIIQQVASLQDETAPSPGAGTQHRMEGENLTASSLEVAGHIYHLSAIV